MAIKISGTTVIDDNRNWVGNPITNVEYAGSQAYNTPNTQITLTSTSPQFIQINNLTGEIVLPTASSVSGGFRRFIVENNTSEAILINSTSNVLPGRIMYCSVVNNTWDLISVKRTASITNDLFRTVFSYSQTISNPMLETVPIDSTRYLILFRDDSNSGYGAAQVMTINETSINPGIEVNPGNRTYFISAALDINSISATLIDTNKILVVYNLRKAKILTITGTSISVGPEYDFNDTTATSFTVAKLDTNKAIVVFRDTGNSDRATARVLSVSGTVITAETKFVYNFALTSINTIAVLTPTRAVVSFREGSTSWIMRLAVSGTTVSQIGLRIRFPSGVTDLSSVIAFDEKTLVLLGKDSATPTNIIYSVYKILDTSTEGIALTGTSIKTPFTGGTSVYTVVGCRINGNTGVIGICSNETDKNIMYILFTIAGSNLQFLEFTNLEKVQNLSQYVLKVSPIDSNTFVTTYVQFTGKFHYTTLSKLKYSVG
jgi:hypothetical protein